MAFTSTLREKRFPYEQYYVGEKDELEQRSGTGENVWTGAESLESYTGNFLQDTMHGEGEYRWRYKDPDGAFVTYEGWFYANQMHGYGVMSYPNGKVFTGLFHTNSRWGPGIEQMPSLHSNVGLWRGLQLARLAWLPVPHSVIPDLNHGPIGPSFVKTFRTVLAEKVKNVGQINSAIDLLKSTGADPALANEIWPKLYPKTCGDPASALFHRNLFDFYYYKDKIYTLEKESGDMHITENESIDQETERDDANYFAWNDSEAMVHMMRHAYTHEHQRSKVLLNLPSILNGPREQYRPPGKHERDCRAVLLGSYCGEVTFVVTAINEEDVYADIADVRGNTALMYAVCGDQLKIMRFLVEAGADVNSYNDSCCTPLGIALMRYIGSAHDLNLSELAQGVLPPAPMEVDTSRATEWNMTRGTASMPTTPSKIRKSSLSRTKSTASKKSAMKPSEIPDTCNDVGFDSDEDIETGDTGTYQMIKAEYIGKVREPFVPNWAKSPVPYLFKVDDILPQLVVPEETISAKNKLRTGSKHTASSKTKILPQPTKSNMMFENITRDTSILESAEKLKHDKLTVIQLTILELLSLGADPKLVVCPRPAVFMALKTKNPDILSCMVSHGADVNQKYPDLFGYTVLDIILSEEVSSENLQMLNALLASGADANHRIPIRIKDGSMFNGSGPPNYPRPSLGPTLLHVVLAKNVVYEYDQDIIRQMIQLLLEHNCDPLAQYEGSSAIDTAINRKFHLLSIFIKCPTTDLSAIINSQNQSILVKLFTQEFMMGHIGTETLIPVITSLLLYGADPLRECYNGEEKYGNIFEFARQTYDNVLFIEKSKSNPRAPSGTKVKKSGTLESFKRRASAASAITSVVDAKKYKAALELMTDCTRLLHVRWIQGKLARDLIRVVYKFKQRPWITIIREHKDGYLVGLWLSASRGLEIWEILKTFQNKKYTDDNILRKFVSIIQFYTDRVDEGVSVSEPILAVEKNYVDMVINKLLNENKISSEVSEEAKVWKKHYVMPELDVKGGPKYQVCFECHLRLTEHHVECYFCHLVSFCNLRCLVTNVKRSTGHYCSQWLADRFCALPGED